MNKTTPYISLILIIVGILLIIPYSMFELSTDSSPSDNSLNNGVEIIEITIPCGTPKMCEEDEEIVVTSKYYNVPLSHELQDYIYQVLDEYRLPEWHITTVLGIIHVESRYKPDVVRGNCIGLMQVSTIHNKKLAKIGVKNLTDPYQNVKAGIYILKECFDWCDEVKSQYSDVSYIDLALLAYNNGKTGAKRLLNKGIYTTSYVDKVTSAISVLNE